jgi:hypothetical protein
VDERRIARNNATFRDANERIRASAEAYALDGGLLPFICECADASCTTVIQVGFDDYRRVRETPQPLFVIARGHSPAEGQGSVVEEHETFEVFEKAGPAAELLEEG